MTAEGCLECCLHPRSRHVVEQGQGQSVCACVDATGLRDEGSGCCRYTAVVYASCLHEVVSTAETRVGITDDAIALTK